MQRGRDRSGGDRQLKAAAILEAVERRRTERGGTELLKKRENGHFQQWVEMIEEEVGKSNEERQLHQASLFFLMLDSIESLLISIEIILGFTLLFVFLIFSRLAL